MVDLAALSECGEAMIEPKAYRALRRGRTSQVVRVVGQVDGQAQVERNGKLSGRLIYWHYLQHHYEHVEWSEHDRDWVPAGTKLREPETAPRTQWERMR